MPRNPTVTRIERRCLWCQKALDRETGFKVVRMRYGRSQVFEFLCEANPCEDAFLKDRRLSNHLEAIINVP